MPSVRRAALAIIGALSLIVATPVLGWAHATLVSADPAASGRLTASPLHIRLQFSEELEPALGRIALQGSDGRIVRLVVSGDPHDVNAIMAPVHETLAPGAYRVLWRVVSSDGHPVSGSYVFTVTGSDSMSAAVAPLTIPDDMHDGAHGAMPVPMHDGGMSDEEMSSWGPSLAGAPLIPALLRGLAVGTLMSAAGLFLFIGWSDRANGAASSGAARLARVLTVAFSLLLPLHLLAWALNASPEHRLGGDMLAATLTSGVGRLELWRTGLALVSAWAFLLARRPRTASVFALLALVASGATGHSAAIEPLWTTPAKALHLVAGAVWLGGLLWLLTFNRNDSGRFEREALRVSSLALGAVVVVTLSGVMQWSFFLPTIRGLFDSAYGIVTTAKIAGLLVLVGFGAHHKFRIIPRLRRDPNVAGRFAATLRSEIVVMSIVLLLGGMLGYLSPPQAMHSHDSTTHTTSP